MVKYVWEALGWRSFGRISLGQGFSESALAAGIERDSDHGIWRKSSWGPGHRPPTTRFLGDQCALVALCFWHRPAIPDLPLRLTPRWL